MHRILNDPRSLDLVRRRDACRRRRQRYEDKELAVRKQRQYEFLCHLEELINDLLEMTAAAETTTEWKPAACGQRPDWN